MPEHRTSLALLPGECWWGGATALGTKMPFGPGSGCFGLNPNNTPNQASPFLVSNKGRYVWSDDPFDFAFDGDSLVIIGQGRVTVHEGSQNLRGAYRAAQSKYFPATGNMPDPMLFSVPQYNTWIELMYEQCEEGILGYAEALVRGGYPPGVLMIDDNWQEDYGVWEFSAKRFNDPRAMIDRLHALGFRVMLWTCPFVSPDSATYRQLRDEGILLRDAEGRPAIREWWNGHSAVLDLTNPKAAKWYHSRNLDLMERYGIDGFKLDAGDPCFYRDTDRAHFMSNPNEHCQAFATFGLRYRLNEYRSCWKMGGQPLAQRLCDKAHSWGEDGLASLIPNGLAMGLLGHPFVCPDMIGGGEYLNFMANSASLDQELFVRYAQCAALFPMMQFSAAPWRVLDARHAGLCLEAALLHHGLGDGILSLARDAAITGEPIMRHMAYDHPDSGFEGITDQFMLGSDILVAPVLGKGAVSRTVAFPPGVWQGDDGGTVQGPCTLTVDAPLERLPWYRRIG